MGRHVVYVFQAITFMSQPLWISIVCQSTKVMGRILSLRGTIHGERNMQKPSPRRDLHNFRPRIACQFVVPHRRNYVIERAYRNFFDPEENTLFDVCCESLFFF